MTRICVVVAVFAGFVLASCVRTVELIPPPRDAAPVVDSTGPDAPSIDAAVDAP